MVSSWPQVLASAPNLGGAPATTDPTTGWLLLVLYVGGALSISFLCSILEAGILSVRASELHTRAKQGDQGAAILLDLKENRIDDSISAILTLNTIAHTIGAALAGAQAAAVFGDPWVGAFSGVLTLLVLVFTEIIPKTLGTAKASELAGFVGRTVSLLTRALAPLLWFTRALTRLIAKEEKHQISRGELAVLVGMAARQGTLMADQSRVFENVLRLEEIRVEDIMTPRTVALMAPMTMKLGEFLDLPGSEIFTRIPLYSGDRDQIEGYVFQRDVLRAAARGEASDRPLADFKRPTWFLLDQTSLTAALKQFVEHPEHMAMVTDEFGAVQGLVTLEDVIETVLGAEIVDESDRHVDLRELAKQRRDARTKRQQEERAASNSKLSKDDRVARPTPRT